MPNACDRTLLALEEEGNYVHEQII